MMKLRSRWIQGLLFSISSFVAIIMLSACSVNPSALGSSLVNANVANNSFSFAMIPSPGINACLPNAKGNVTIIPGALNDQMTVSVSGLAPNTEYDLFVTELPNKPFGIAWYQSDLDTNSHGAGSVTVRGIFDAETFSVSTGGPNTTFRPTHQYHLGLWFNDPKVPFRLGCEHGQTQPIVTPFNGEQHAGIQVLNTANFPVNAGPLSHVHR